MSLKFADTEDQYKKDKTLKKEDVKALMDWADKQPHLPKINEIQAIHFLHSCMCSNEAAKKTMDEFFTLKTVCSDVFRNRDISLKPLQHIMNTIMMTVLPKKTPEGYTVFFITVIDRNTDNFNFATGIKMYDMLTMLHLYLEGIADGYMIVIEFNNVHMGHVTKLGPLTMKTLLYYLQEALPVRMKGLHFLNVAPLVDKIVFLMKPFMKKDLWNVFHLHPSVNEMAKFIPTDILPKEFGGSAESVSVMHEEMKKKLASHTEYFKWEDTMYVDESKRVGKSSTLDSFGTHGTFKKLELD